jgi:Ca2+-dependent lipid-binding protein
METFVAMKTVTWNLMEQPNVNVKVNALGLDAMQA